MVPLEGNILGESVNNDYLWFDCFSCACIITAGSNRKVSKTTFIFLSTSFKLNENVLLLNRFLCFPYFLFTVLNHIEMSE